MRTMNNFAVSRTFKSVTNDRFPNQNRERSKPTLQNAQAVAEKLRAAARIIFANSVGSR